MARSAEELLKKYQSLGKVPQGGRGPGGGPGGGKNRGAGGKPKDTQGSILRLLRYLNPYKFHVLIAVICVLISTGATLAGSYMLRPIINGLVDNADLWSLALSLGYMAAIYLAGVIASYAQQRLMIWVSQSVLKNIRDDLFRKLQNLPVRYYDTHSNGELMSRFMNDVDAIGEMMNNSVIQLFSGSITLIGTLILMMSMNLWLTLITIVFVPLVARVGGLIASRSRRFYRAQQAALGAVNGYVEESITGQKVVKVFCHEDVCEEEFGLLNKDLRDKQIKAQFFGGLMGPVLGNMSQITYAITACIGGILCVTQGFDVGGFSVFVNYSRQFSRPINEISMQVNTIFSALAGAERVFAVMDEEPEAADAPDALEVPELKGHVQMQHVYFGYDPDVQILKDISLYAKPGQKIAFVGSTGAGKTTITNLLSRFYDIQEGSILVDGHDLYDYKRKFIRSHIAMVLQDTHLFTGTVMENIRYGRLDATDEEVIEAAKAAKVHHFIQTLPGGYQMVLNEEVTNISQGQKQLLTIARAILANNKILILDEATSSVDTRTEIQIQEAMDHLMEGRTSFIIAHRLSTIRNADWILFLKDGDVVEQGTHDELLAKGGAYAELYNSQFQETA